MSFRESNYNRWYLDMLDIRETEHEDYWRNGFQTDCRQFSSSYYRSTYMSNEKDNTKPHQTRDKEEDNFSISNYLKTVCMKLLYTFNIFTHFKSKLIYKLLFFFYLLKIKSVAYSSQRSHTDQLDFCNWPADGNTTG